MAHSDLQLSDSGGPQRAHLESPPHPTPPSPARVTSGNRKRPASLPLQPSGLRGKVPPGFHSRPQWTRRPGGGGWGLGAPGWGATSGRGPAGAAPTSSTVSGMQIRYSFSSMVLPAADSRDGKQGRPPKTNKAAAQAQGRALGASGRSSPRCALSSWLPPVRPRACQGLGSGIRGSPLASFLAEVGPPGERCCKVREREGGKTRWRRL